ncbi:hypothetical protein GNI_228950 [Gregarina niphandrodes]|uniref:Uncharacterized protein n=1 Tax=Gregarina niphandrodes TaxID=110365 RepID=A0A023AWE9_GRENI|nr:hypothetical protein GNI_228950 [Gregarina niphandrodes]EZG42763.1 hypothetical protein GNI_228950 [Gregarina niphandrodes]|eukprot:XP_011133957.1 hypothetical protein GNI_228950 [Gregarina niphandrodes]
MLVLQKDPDQVGKKLWSLPKKLTSVSELGYRARVRDIGSGKVQERHWSRLRPIDPPKNPEQFNSWLNEFGQEGIELGDKDLLEELGAETQIPQVSPSLEDSPRFVPLARAREAMERIT